MTLFDNIWTKHHAVHQHTASTSVEEPCVDCKLGYIFNMIHMLLWLFQPDFAEVSYNFHKSSILVTQMHRAFLCVQCFWGAGTAVQRTTSSHCARGDCLPAVGYGPGCIRYPEAAPPAADDGGQAQSSQPSAHACCAVTGQHCLPHLTRLILPASAFVPQHTCFSLLASACLPLHTGLYLLQHSP